MLYMKNYKKWKSIKLAVGAINPRSDKQFPP